MGKHLSAFCIHCQEKTLHIKKTPNHVLHLLLTILTAGLWLIVWILVGMSSASEKWRCSKCGTPITAKDRVEKNAKKKCPFCAEEIQADANKCKHCNEWLSDKESAESKPKTTAPHRIPCADGKCTGALNAKGVCGYCKRTPEEVQKGVTGCFPELETTVKNKNERSCLGQFFIFAVVVFGLLSLLAFFNGKMFNTPTTTPQTKKHAATTQKKKVISPTQIKKQPAVDDKKLLKTDNYFGNFINPVIKKGSGTVQLKVWQPYIDYMHTLPAQYQAALLKPPYGLTVEYDEIWVHEYDEIFTAQKKKEWKGQFDINTLYWKNNKIQAYTLEKFYERHQTTNAPLNAHQITSIYGRNSILTEIQK